MDFVSLNCPACGGKIDVYNDVDRFACAYCGVQATVARRGGTVSLSQVAEAIKSVQRGTDRTAAELAIVRLEKDLTAVSLEIERLTKAQQTDQKKVSESRLSAVWAIVMTAVLGFVDRLLFANGYPFMAVIGALVVVGFGRAAYVGYHAEENTLIARELRDAYTAKRNIEAERKKQLAVVGHP